MPAAASAAVAGSGEEADATATMEEGGGAGGGGARVGGGGAGAEASASNEPGASAFNAAGAFSSTGAGAAGAFSSTQGLETDGHPQNMPIYCKSARWRTIFVDLPLKQQIVCYIALCFMCVVCERGVAFSESEDD